MSAFSLLQLAHKNSPYARSDPIRERQEGEVAQQPLTLPSLQTMGIQPSAFSLSGIYSTSGFDALRLLARLPTRPNQKVDIGPVDFSCSFLVTDIRKPEHPIVYVSETFTKLTGYSEAEILGRNCRFLQSPDGNVAKGSIRKYTDNDTVRQIKESVDRLEECQYTLINYKKTGEPFINLMTLIPISLADDEEIQFYVGLQVDLVDQPQAILDRMKDGTYNVNYQIGDRIAVSKAEDTLFFDEEIPDMLAPAHSPLNDIPMPPTIPSDAPSATGIIHSYTDFLHILSLRGLFLYASPTASKHVLEYSAEEIMGHPLSEFVHPADLVSVMRELRTATPEDGINIICRFRRKYSGYVYMEINGHIYEGDAGKRTKCFILTGRERYIGCLPASNILIPRPRTHETWARLSPQGIVLHICTNAVELFGQFQEDIYARSIFDLTSELSHDGIQSALDRVTRLRTTQQVHCHIINKRATSSALMRFYSDGDPFARTVYVQIRAGDADGSLMRENDTLAQCENSGLGASLLDAMGEVKVTSLHYELNQLRIQNKRLRDEVEGLTLPVRKRTKTKANVAQECAQCGTNYSPEWRKGPDNQRNLCNACGLRWAKSLRRNNPVQMVGVP